MGYNLVSRGEALGFLGRFDEARALLDQATAIADRPGGELKRLSVESQLALAQLDFMQGKFPDARNRAGKVVEAAGTEFKHDTMIAKIVIGLSESYRGGKGAGKQLTGEALEWARQLNDPAYVAQAQLGLAEAMLLSGDSQAALSNAKQAAEILARLGQQASEWRAVLIAARASQNLGDKGAAREYAMRARDTLSKLELRWGSENYNSYLRRPDIQRFREQLDQLIAAV